MRLLESLSEQNIIPLATANVLKHAYCFYRNLGHKQVLQGDKAIINEEEVADLRLQVESIWQTIME